MSDEDTILEARKLAPLYICQITWSAAEQVWIAHIPEFHNLSAQGESAEAAQRNAQEAIFSRLLDLKEAGNRWPMPRRQPR